MKFIKLTNSVMQGSPIWINIDQITAVFEKPSQEGGSLQTHIFGGNTANGVTWIVDEGISEVIKFIKEA